MPSMAGTLGLGGLWEPFAAPVAAFLEDWLALQYLLPLISFVCVGLEGWCFFDLMRKTLGARSAAARGAAVAAASSVAAAAAAADARNNADASLEYDVVKDFPNGGFEPCKFAPPLSWGHLDFGHILRTCADMTILANNQLCIHGLLGIKLHARHSTACLSNP
jgi:hypothetical protein